MENLPKLLPPHAFLFPFAPYGIQNDFMRALFRVIEDKKIGIFESPTGTGKSLSIICGALTWLKAHRTNLELHLQSVIKDESTILEANKIETTDWLSADYESTKAKDALKSQRNAVEKVLHRETEWKKRREKMARQRKLRGKQKDDVSDTLLAITSVLNEAKTGVVSDSTDADLLVDYNSDEESLEIAGKVEEEESPHVRKIYYATRTHSQIAQFINELKKSPFGKDTRVAAVASRQNLCVFEPVRKLKWLRLMNDRCLELQKGSREKGADGGKKRAKRDPDDAKSCPYFAREAVDKLSDEILSSVQDIEDLAKSGIASLGCPYYASRSAISDAEAFLHESLAGECWSLLFILPEKCTCVSRLDLRAILLCSIYEPVSLARVVAVPYNLLLHRSTREASGINLKDQVVIVDEAHNLLEAISGMYTCEVSELHVRKSRSQLQQYFTRYRTRLSAKNVLNIKQLMLVLDHLNQFWTKTAADASTGQVYNSDQFLIASDMESINLRDVLAYCRKSFISRKLMGYTERYPDAVPVPPSAHDQSCASPLMIIEGFLETLTNAPLDGRIILHKDASGTQRLKFLLLNSAVYVKDIFADARSVIFAGGTMQPVSDFEDQLLFMAGVPVSRIEKFSCEHIIAPDRILPIALQKSPAGKPFQFTYQNRDDKDMVFQLIRTVQNLCSVVPGGIVCFFSSYDHEEKVYRLLAGSPETLKVIEKKKKIFREPKTSGEVEHVLSMYSKSIASPTDGRTGALMLAVVGGKLSEGINFSDDLGRCVVMVGLPFPNRGSLDLVEKMKFLDGKLGKAADGRLPSQLHYEGLCMKAVNQSIGRAIRHKDDYAAILLVDSRYGNENIKRSLPGWIGSQLKTCSEFAPAFSAIRQFFAAKQPKPQ